jgi:hydroxymethylglutaryl-CoA lyase
LESGLTEIEVTSFVSPKWVPQLADAAELWPQLPAGGKFSALVPNVRGMELAVNLGVSRVAVFTATSDAFTQKNINMTVKESIASFRELMSLQPSGTWVRGYVSTAFECPYTGRMKPALAMDVAEALIEIGCNEISFGDTIGVAGPREVKELADTAASLIRHVDVFWHFHDTWGSGIANVFAALNVSENFHFDASAGGLGGCPYAPGAAGNIATEDLIYALDRAGVSLSVDLQTLAQASLPILRLLNRAPRSKAQIAALARLQ